jgi:hypothetical protein
MTKMAWYSQGNHRDPANSPILALTGEWDKPGAAPRSQHGGVARGSAVHVWPQARWSGGDPGKRGKLSPSPRFVPLSN